MSNDSLVGVSALSHFVLQLYLQLIIVFLIFHDMFLYTLYI